MQMYGMGNFIDAKNINHTILPGLVYSKLRTTALVYRLCQPSLCEQALQCGVGVSLQVQLVGGS